MGGAGKTETINRLRDTFRLNIFIVPYDEVWWDRYDDELYDMILFDEFKGQITITKLNQILSGDYVSISKRGQPPYLKKKNLPVVILSNYTPHEAYNHQNPLSLQPLVDRLEVLDFTVEDYPYVRLEPQVPIDSHSQTDQSVSLQDLAGEGTGLPGPEPAQDFLDSQESSLSCEMEDLSDLETYLDPEFDTNNEPWMWDPQYISALQEHWTGSQLVTLKTTRQKKRQKTSRVIEDYFE